MKFRKLTAGLTASLLVAGGLVASALPASATPIEEECVPSEAWIEDVPDITHPAVGTPTIIVENPDYVPAVDPIPATYGTEWKYTKHGGHGFLWLDNDTYKYAFPDGTGTNTKPKGKNVVYYERTQHTRQVELTPAVPGVPAQGEPTIEIENPDYVPEWIEITPDIEHPAVECPPAEEPEEPEEPVYFLTTSHVAVCGELSISLRNVSPWLYRVLIETETAPGVWERVDGTVSGAGIYAAKGVLMVDNRGDAPDDQTGTYTVTFPEDSGTHNVRYKVSSGAEQDLYVGLPVGEFTTTTVESDCETEVPVDPEEPTDPEEPIDPETPVEEPEEPIEEPTPTSLPQGGSDDTFNDLEIDELAQTGGHLVNPWAYTLGALAVALGAAATMFGFIARHRRQGIES